jgi:hypothetical protein
MAETMIEEVARLRSALSNLLDYTIHDEDDSVDDCTTRMDTVAEIAREALLFQNLSQLSRGIKLVPTADNGKEEFDLYFFDSPWGRFDSTQEALEWANENLIKFGF